MAERSEEQQVLISGYLDGELDAEGRARLEALAEADPVFRREFDAMKRLAVGTSAAFHMDEPPDEVWDDFLDKVYNRLERRTGWLILIAGLVALGAAAVFAFVWYDWGPAWLKVILALVWLGLVVLFISVLRERLEVAKTDRYSREVQR